MRLPRKCIDLAVDSLFRRCYDNKENIQNKVEVACFNSSPFDVTGTEEKG